MVDTCKQHPIKLPDGSLVPQRWEILPSYNSMNRDKKTTKANKVLIDLLGEKCQTQAVKEG